MKTAVLTHTHKFGHDTYISWVGNRATMDDSDAIIQAMIKEHHINYEKTTSEQDAMGDGEDLELRMYERGELGVIPIGFPKRSISSGVWRFSSEGGEVTTSRLGVLEGSKRVCDVSAFSKTREEVQANGRALAAVPEMLDALESAQLYFEVGSKVISKRQVQEKVGLALKKAVS